MRYQQSVIILNIGQSITGTLICMTHKHLKFPLPRVKLKQNIIPVTIYMNYFVEQLRVINSKVLLLFCLTILNDSLIEERNIIRQELLP